MSCRLSKSQDWATRIHHEATQHEFNCFVTLTFADEHLPTDMSVDIRDVQLFMKRLRKRLGHDRVRYFACGEYGDRFQRPHYHVILFGYSPADLVPWRKTGSGFVVSRSAELERVWPFGHVEVGTVTHQSAGYVARYVIKKATGEAVADSLTRIHPTTLFPWQVRPEFIVMSRRPGIGDSWFAQFSGDAFPSDFVIVDGRKKPIPRYYDKKLSDREALSIKSTRKENAAKHADEQTTRRLLTKTESATLRAERLPRTMDTES